jgi:hypothetical protein
MPRKTRPVCPDPLPVGLRDLIPADLAEHLAQQGIKTTHDWRPLKWRTRIKLGLSEAQVLRVDAAVCLDLLKRMPPLLTALCQCDFCVTNRRERADSVWNDEPSLRWARSC